MAAHGRGLDDNAEKVLKRAGLPVAVAGNEKRVRRDFWPKLKRYLARLPFAEDLIAAYYCAIDPATPSRAKALLFAALAYFIVPGDLIPDFFAGLGFTDDLTVLMAAISLVRIHLKDSHRAAARKALDGLKTPSGG
jgi:uncharacterized membrane protein YkvA (DUF1232 family)